MKRHWLVWATTLLTGLGSAWATDPAPAVEPEEAPAPLTLEYEPLTHDGQPGAWIPFAEVKKLNLWQIELREGREIRALEGRREALQAELDEIRGEGQALAQKRLELEIERTKLAQEEAELERQRANRAERRGWFSRVLGFVGLAAGVLVAR